MTIKNKPMLRISLYNYGEGFPSFLLAFINTALKAGWSNDELQKVFVQIDNLNDLKALNYLMQYACIVKLQKGVRIKNGKII